MLDLDIANTFRRSDDEFAAIHGTIFRRGGTEPPTIV